MKPSDLETRNQGAKWRLVSLSFSCFLLICLTACEQDHGLDRPPEEEEVRYSPEDGDQTAVNPPPFVWLPEPGVDSWIVQYSRTPSFAAGQTVTVRDIDMTVYIPTEVMETGDWYWRYGYNAGSRDIFSRTRSFEIPENAVDFPLVTADQMIERIPVERPRLYFTPELVADIRENPDNRYDFLDIESVVSEAEEILSMNEPLFEEPDPWPEENYREIYYSVWRPMRPYTQRMVTSALAYLYTGDERFAAEARRRLMHFMSWDVDGASASVWPDEVGLDIAENATPVFDWIYDTLSDEDRAICIDILGKRMAQINEDVHRARPMDSSPYRSHEGRAVAFVIEGGIVLAHEDPDAGDWLDYTLRLFWSTYPSWGGDDGGWHEGIGYWGSYMRRMIRVVNELDKYDIPLKNKPFFQNTGYFGMYVGYPDRPTRAFGDGHHHELGNRAGIVTYMLSSLYENPYFRWHAEASGAGPSGRAAARFYKPELESRLPTDLPQSRIFESVGIAAMHSDMADIENNVMMLFKSNPFGGMSHNHASQNAFVIEAYGEPLAISSGYRTTHGLPHHTEWIWQTKAHNSILVDGEGQIPRSRKANGELIDYQENGAYMFVTGDATPAYGDLLERFHRSIAFVRPNYYVIVDDVETKRDASTYQWLFHAINRLQVDNENQIFVSTSGDARLTARLLLPDDLELIQRTGFDPPTEDPDIAPDQYHLTASTRVAAPSQRFVTVIWVDRPGREKMAAMRAGENPVGTKTAPESDQRIRTLENLGIYDSDAEKKALEQVKIVEATGGLAVQVGNDLILWKEDNKSQVEAAGVTSTSRMTVKRDFFN